MSSKCTSQHCGLVHGGNGSTDSGNSGTPANTTSAVMMPAVRGRTGGSPHGYLQHGSHDRSGAGPRPLRLSPASGMSAVPLAQYVVDLPRRPRTGRTPHYIGMDQRGSATMPLQVPSTWTTPGSMQRPPTLTVLVRSGCLPVTG